METIKSAWFENERIYMMSDEDRVYSRPLEAFPILKEADDRERKNFRICLKGTALRWDSLDEDIHISSFHKDEEPTCNNEVAAIFRRFPQLNLSVVAKEIGIHKSLLLKYIYGVVQPDEHQLLRIKKSLHGLGQQLVDI